MHQPVKRAPEALQLVAVHDGVQSGVEQHQQELQIAYPVSEHAATRHTQVDDVDEDAGREIAGDKQQQHHHQCAGDFALCGHGQPLRVVFQIAFVHSVQAAHLYAERLEDFYVGDQNDRKCRNDCRVRENKAMDVVANYKVDRVKRHRDEPDSHADLHCAVVTHARPVFEWVGYCGETVQSHRSQPQERRCTRDEEGHVSGRYESFPWRYLANCFPVVGKNRLRVDYHSDKKVGKRQVDEKAVERATEFLIRVQADSKKDQGIAHGSSNPQHHWERSRGGRKCDGRSDAFTGVRSEQRHPRKKTVPTVESREPQY